MARELFHIEGVLEVQVAEVALEAQNLQPRRRASCLLHHRSFALLLNQWGRLSQIIVVVLRSTI